MSFGSRIFKSLLSLVKEFIVNTWEVRKQKSRPNQLQTQSSPGGLGGAVGVEDRKLREGSGRKEPEWMRGRELGQFYVHVFSENVKRKVEGGVRGHDLVNEVLKEWESINRSEVGTWLW